METPSSINLIPVKRSTCLYAGTVLIKILENKKVILFPETLTLFKDSKDKHQLWSVERKQET